MRRLRTLVTGLALAVLIGSLVLAVPAVVLAVPAAVQAAETPRRGGVLLAAIAADAPSLDPHQEQTFATIAPYTVEEAYEVADAIERGDLGDLRGGGGRDGAKRRRSQE